MVEGNSQKYTFQFPGIHYIKGKLFLPVRKSKLQGRYLRKISSATDIRVDNNNM